MAIHGPLFSCDERLVGSEVLVELRRGLARRGEAVLLVPDSATAVEARRSLASEGLSLGVTTTTPELWAAERWQVWGDGTGIISAGQRVAAMGRVFAESSAEGGSLVNNPGTVRVLARLAREGLPWLLGAREAQPQAWSRLTGAERRAVGLLESYARTIHELGYSETCEVMTRVPQLLANQGVPVPPVVVVGFTALGRGQLELLRGLGNLAEVTLVLRPGNPEAMGIAASTVGTLCGGVGAGGEGSATAAGRGDPTTVEENARHEIPCEPFGESCRSAELADLLNGLFSCDGTADLRSRGGVSLVLPAGPAAEAEAVARALTGAVAGDGPEDAPIGRAVGGDIMLGSTEPQAYASGKGAAGGSESLAAASGGGSSDGGASSDGSTNGGMRPLVRSAAADCGSTPKHVVVSTGDVARAWRELAPKLVRRGMGVRAQISLPVTQTHAGQALLGYLSGVARLVCLARMWPGGASGAAAGPEAAAIPGSGVGLGRGAGIMPGSSSGSAPGSGSGSALGSGGRAVPGLGSGSVPGPSGGSVPGASPLGDMSWWPPRELTDFLLSGLSGMPAERAMRLDAEWRGNRLLTPGDVLRRLGSSKESSAAVAAATREMVAGRPNRAVAALLRGLDTTPDAAPAAFCRAPELRRDVVADALCRQVLARTLQVFDDLRSAGVTYDPAADGPEGLENVIAALRGVLDEARVVVRPEVWPADPVAEVELLAPGRIARLPRGSADVLVLMGQTSVEAPIGNGDDVATQLLQGLGVEPALAPMDQARSAFVEQLAVAREKVLFERTLFDAGAKECYSSVMLIEALGAYGIAEDLKPRKLEGSLAALDGRGLDHLVLSETTAFANGSPSGTAPAVEARESVDSTGVLRPDLVPLTLVPSKGGRPSGDGLPLLSATQIEAYLECPLKWFAQSRLNLKELDAGFGGIQMGTFVHGVLEQTHRELLDEAWQVAGHDGAFDAASQDLRQRLPGCRPLEADAASVQRAQEVLGQVFESERARQFVRGKRALSDPLVPHSAEDEGAFDGLRRDLASTVEYESHLFLSYEPRLFEQRFGRGQNKTLVEYAGVHLVGAIDRVDVDGEGRAVVIDYKHRSHYGFNKAYDAFGWAGCDLAAEPLTLPRHVQALIYAQVLRRAHPELTVTGSVYLCTRGRHALAGAVSEDSVDRVFGRYAPRDAASVAVPYGQMDELLARTEEAVAQKVQELLAGRVEPSPVDKDACKYCPVLACERRLS